ncbi:hypothetical protein C0J52_12479 [Blattella germanica]|nr:hypothetical protein C0J52_12479 [Blattella germanica]
MLNMFVMLVMVCGVSHIFAHPLSGSMTQNESESSTAIVSDTTTQSALDESSTSTTQTVLGVFTETESDISTQTEIGEPSTTEIPIWSDGGTGQFLRFRTGPITSLR